MEDDTLEGVYASEQPLIDCGFIRDQYIWTQTSINSVEVITVENQDIFSKITQFPHHVDYVIGCSVEQPGDRMIIYGGNNLGEVYIYEMTGKNQVTLIDMVFMPHPCIVRNVKMVGEGIIAVTAESGELAFFKHNP